MNPKFTDEARVFKHSWRAPERPISQMCSVEVEYIPSINIAEFDPVAKAKLEDLRYWPHLPRHDHGYEFQVSQFDDA